MAHLLAAREALDRFNAEFGSASHGVSADGILRASAVTRGLIEEALAEPAAASAWVDHNLGVIVALSLADDEPSPAALTLFAGVQRRLSAALEEDPDDLVLALALARGVGHSSKVAHSAKLLRLISEAACRQQAGPRLVSAAVQAVLAAGRSNDKALAAAAAEAVDAVAGALQSLSGKLPNHPGLALDIIELMVQKASATQGESRSQALTKARGLLVDHDNAFGDSERGRRLRADVLALLARSGGSAADVRIEASRMLGAAMSERTLRGKTAERLIRAMDRAGALDTKSAQKLTKALEEYLHEHRQSPSHAKAWRNAFGMLLKNSGNQAGLVAHWERTLEEDPDNAEAAKGLAIRLLQNLRANLKVPFPTGVLDRVLAALKPSAMARWSADDAHAVLKVTEELLGTSRAAEFARDQLLVVREFKRKNAVHDRGLELFQALGDDAATLAFAEKAVERANHAASRLYAAEVLLDRGERLSRAESLLTPLLDVRGSVGKRAQTLRQKLARHPSLQQSHRAELIAFEEGLGVGSGRALSLRVVFVSAKYVLAEVTERPAPDCYEHKHLRTMLKADDLPKGVMPLDLRKGDTLQAPLSGQDANPKRDKSGLRVYWVADATAVTLGLDATAIEARWQSEEARFGVGSEQLLPLKVAWDSRKSLLTVRAFSGASGGHEFPIRPTAAVAQLPEGVDAERLGKNGKRFWGRLVRDTEATSRAYRVDGQLLKEEPDASKADAAANVASAPRLEGSISEEAPSTSDTEDPAAGSEATAQGNEDLAVGASGVTAPADAAIEPEEGTP